MATFNIEGAEIETASFEELAAVYDLSKPVDTFLRDRYFSDETYLNNEDKVPVGEIKSYIPLAPAVLPTAQGRVIEEKVELNVKHIPAPYFKPSVVVEPSSKVDAKMKKLLQSMKVIATNGIGVAPTMQDEWEMAAATSYWAIRQSLAARIAIMCRDALLYGKVVVEGDDNAGVTVDYERHSDLTFSPLIAWDQTGATPYEDIRGMVKDLVKHGKRRPVDALMSSRVFDAMADNEEFNDKFTASKDSTATRVFDGAFGGETEATLRGTLDGIEFWTYDVEFEKADGTSELMIPEDGFWLISERANKLYFCMIKHRKNPAKLAMELMPYHVFSDDPSVDKFIADSSPLPVPINKNGACGGTGFITL
ncbi:major capsid protein [Psychrobacter sp. ER1]|uniref:major capsid protein n=1 Tax=Psychrobacter sp. ER1 TaxID=3406645 RepID=UPI003B438DDA